VKVAPRIIVHIRHYHSVNNELAEGSFSVAKSRCDQFIPTFRTGRAT
jgi:hypothetical protein